jgi:hypothetical protein
LKVLSIEYTLRGLVHRGFQGPGGGHSRARRPTATPARAPAARRGNSGKVDKGLEVGPRKTLSR